MRTTHSFFGRGIQLLSRVCAAAVWPRSQAARSGAAAYASLGRVSLDTQRLRALLPTMGYPPPHAAPLTFGGGGYGRIGRRLAGVLGFGGGGIHRRKHFRTATGFGGGSLFTGYTAYEGEHWRIYPFAGLGGSGQGFNVRPARRKPTPAEQAMLPAGGTGGPAAYAGWTTEYRLRLLPQAGLLIGVQIGWTFAPVRLPWFVRGFGDVRLPLPRAARPHVHILVGAFIESA